SLQNAREDSAGAVPTPGRSIFAGGLLGPEGMCCPRGAYRVQRVSRYIRLLKGAGSKMTPNLTDRHSGNRIETASVRCCLGVAEPEKVRELVPTELIAQPCPVAVV